jgi:hypothetical protein
MSEKSNNSESKRAGILAPGDGPRVYTPLQMQALLGVKASTYYRIRKLGLLAYSRLYPGGPVIHTQQEFDDYLAYLNSQGRVGSGPSRVRRAS